MSRPEKIPIMVDREMTVPSHDGIKTADVMMSAKVANMEWEPGEWCTVLIVSSPIHGRAVASPMSDSDAEHMIHLLENAVADNRAARAGLPMRHAIIEEERRKAGKPS